MQSHNPKFDGEWYEDVGDLLAGFRKKNKGAAMGTKKKPDPFANDPDVLQAKRQEKLEEKQRNMFLGGY